MPSTILSSYLSVSWSPWSLMNRASPMSRIPRDALAVDQNVSRLDVAVNEVELRKA